MPHEIETRIADVRRRARRLLVLHAVSLMIAAVVATTLALALADYWIRFRDPGLRVLSLLALLGVLAWAMLHFLRPVFARRLDDVAIAQRIERQFPVLRDRLSSAVEFLHVPPTDHHAGSPALRDLVIAETTSAARDVDMTAVLEPRGTRRALAGAVAVVTLALAAVLFDPASARLALARLANPFGSATWPRQNDLVLRDPPTRIAAGQTFEVELADAAGHALPDEVRIHYLYDTPSGEQEEVETMHLLGGLMVARKENVTRPFQYRAEGGDDDRMAWTTLEVVEPPRIDSLQATLYPPSYTQWPPEPTENNLHALRGTRVAFSGVATRPLRAATLRQEPGPSIPCTLSADGTRFELPAEAPEPMVVDRSGQYWFELEDPEGIIGGGDSRFEIRAITDNPPSVTVERPGASSFVTPVAAVRLQAVAKDDLGVRRVALHFRGTAPTAEAEEQQPAEVEVPLLVVPADEPAARPGVSGNLPGDSRSIDYRWDLAKLGLTPGSQVSFFVSATDAAGQTGRSPERRLSLITAEELADRLAQRQEAILAELRRALKVERDAEGQVSRLAIQLGEVGHLAKGDIDHAQATELSQRHIARTLSDPGDGIPAQITELLSDLASNQVDSPETVSRMQEILAGLEQLEREHLAPAERGLTGAIKAAQADLADATARGETTFKQSPSVAPALAEVDAHQQGVIAALEEMLAGLGQWDSYRRFARDVAQLERDEAELEQATKRLAPELLGKQWKNLQPQQQADLKKLANRQAELGRQLDKLLSAMDESQQRLESDDPLAGARLSDALHHARQQGTTGRMRAAGEELQRNRLGQAAGAEGQVRKDLAEMQEILTGRRENVLEQLVAKLRQAEQDLAALREAHQRVQKDLAEALKTPKPARTPQDEERLGKLTRDQNALEEEAKRLARRLEQLQADAAGRTMQEAIKDLMAQLAFALGDQREAEEQSAAKAQDDLSKAQGELAARRRQAEAQLAREQVAGLEQSLRAWHDRQQEILAETARIDRLPGAGQSPEGAAVGDLAKNQRELETAVRTQAGKLTAAEVTRFALSRAARDMSHAAEGLERGETGAAPQKSEERAAAALARLIESLRPGEPQEGGDEGAGNAGGEGPAGEQQGQRTVASLAELKLLKLMQEDLNARFAELQGAKPSPELAAQLSELAAEQGQFAELAQKMSQPAEPAQNPQPKIPPRPVRPNPLESPEDQI